LAIHFPLRGCRELDSLLRLRRFDFDRIASCACSIASPRHSREEQQYAAEANTTAGGIRAGA